MWGVLWQPSAPKKLLPMYGEGGSMEPHAITVLVLEIVPKTATR